MNTKILLPFLLAPLLLFSSGCTSLEKDAVAEDFTYLTSEECNGRMAGSVGNEAAASYIAKQFEQAGFRPFDALDTYLQPYEQLTFDPGQQTQTLRAYYADGSTKTFQSGIDFYPAPRMEALRIMGEVITVPAAQGETRALQVLTADGEEWLRIYCADTATAELVASGTVALPVPQKLFDQIENCVSLELSGTLEVQNRTVANVIGVYPGTSSDEAILLTAHFDHIGAYGDTLYPGAMDNAAGVATLLHIARLLGEQKPTLPFDVVFCAFNGEDMGLKGSQAFTAGTLPYQSVNAINFDTLGAVGPSTWEVSATDDTLAQNVCNSFNAIGLTSAQAVVGKSDHISLLAYGIPAINVGDGPDAYLGLIHTPADTAEKLDASRIQALGEAVVAYLSTAEVTSLTPHSGEADMAEQLRFQLARETAEEMVAQEQPARDEVVLFQSGGAPFVAWSNVPVTDIAQAQALFPEWSIPSEANGFTFTSMKENGPAICVQAVIGDEGYTDDTIQKKVDTGQNSNITLYYTDKNGITLQVILYHKQSFHLNSFLSQCKTLETDVENGKIYSLSYGDNDLPGGILLTPIDGDYHVYLTCDTEAGYDQYPLAALAALLQDE